MKIYIFPNCYFLIFKKKKEKKIFTKKKINSKFFFLNLINLKKIRLFLSFP